MDELENKINAIDKNLQDFVLKKAYGCSPDDIHLDIQDLTYFKDLYITKLAYVQLHEMLMEELRENILNGGLEN